MNIRAEYKVANATNYEWSGVYGYIPPEPKVYEKLGELLLTIRMKTQKDIVDLEKVAKLVIDELQTSYYENSEDADSVLERLEEASWNLKAILDKVLSREPELMESGLDMELAAAIIIGDFLYCLVVGESNILILRNGEFANISDALIDRDRSGLFRSGSLELGKDDRLLLFTNKTINPEDPKLYKLANSLDVSLLEKIGGQPGSALLLAADEQQEWKDIVVPEEAETKDTETEENDFINDDSEISDLSSDTDLEEDESEFLEQDDYDIQESDSEDGTSRYSQAYSDEFEEFDEYEQEESSPLVENIKNYTSTGLQKGKEISGKVAVMGGSLISKFKQRFSGEQYPDSLIETEEYNREDIVAERPDEHRTEGRSEIRNKPTYKAILAILVNSIRNGLSFAKEFLFEQLVGTRSRRYRDQSKIKRNRYIFAGLCFVLILLLVFSVRSYNERRTQRAAEIAFIENAETLSDKVSNFSTTVTTATVSNVSDRQAKLSSAESLSSEIEAFIAEEQAKEGVTLTEDMSSLLSRLQTDLSDLNSLSNTLRLDKPFSQPQVVADIGLVYAGSQATDLEYSSGQLFVTDSARNVVYRMGTTLNSQIEEYITGLTKPRTLVKNANDEVIVYDENTTSAIGIFSPNDASSFRRFPGLALNEIANIGEVGLFDGNNALYEINLTNGQIFKRVQAGPDYADGGSLLDTLADSNWKSDQILKRAIDIEVPFGIYVLIEGTGLQRYVAGGDNNLSNTSFVNTLSSDINALSNATAIDANDQYVAVGDSVNQRVMLFKVTNIENPGESPLEFTAQYSYSGAEDVFSDIKEIIIQGSELYVLDNARIIRLEI